MPHLVVLFHFPAKSSYYHFHNSSSTLHYMEENQHCTCYFPFQFFDITTSASLSFPLAFLQFFSWWLKKQSLGDDGSNSSHVCIRSKHCLLEGINIYEYLSFFFPFLII
ncbi:hypothetical protein VIGAN_02175900 [Vigna angularis var. angularis]|uniref:Uncharacterized protein n=1 Tax=Vigna angularis var. angularis TaxID=157739 RepID=A0A0S3RE66_PHAAN|nr:hypothetical protein VIGAN_02175900 [Vigna angularis var. angularis]